MATGTFYIRFRVRHIWVLKLINYPLLLLGCRPRVPGICITVEGPFANGEIK
jgi:hypothetical protein